ncbi:MAG: TIGR04282 family arsenosugar biosynthesis glycosyltransferase [Thermoanaerobaculia bacterium]|nr:TIGR04282 family arsenosugar biosynthesis glycosyltransferase [Thermoanaerobaculia bacterium]
MNDSTFKMGERSDRRLLVFAKAPEPGRVKTRLARSMGREAACDVYRSMIRELTDRLGDGKDFDVEVMWTGSSALAGAELVDAFAPYRLARQIGSDLGERMTVAFCERALLQRTTQIIAIGVDLPDIEMTEIESASLLLESCDWVIGPASDGGYYLIGCRAESMDARVFEGIHWGEPSVCDATTDRIRSLGETVALLPERRDIDDFEDLRDYVERHPRGEIASTVERIGIPERSAS